MIPTNCQVIYTEWLLPSYIAARRKPLRKPRCLCFPAVHPITQSLSDLLSDSSVFTGRDFSFFFSASWEVGEVYMAHCPLVSGLSSCSQFFETMKWCPGCLSGVNESPEPPWLSRSADLLSWASPSPSPKAAGPCKWASFPGGRKLCSVWISPAHNYFEQGLPHHTGAAEALSPWISATYLQELTCNKEKNQG